MSDSVTEITRTGFGSRIGSSCLGVVFGFILIAASIIGLWWNEGRAVTAARALAQGERTVVEASPDAVDPSLAGKLVHVTGPLSTATPVRDSQFGVGGRDVVRLQRKVEMYQWKETKSTKTHKEIGGSEETETTYSYSKVWSDRPLDSSRYRRPDGHGNPAMSLTSRTVSSNNARLGAYRVDPAVLAQMDNFAPYATADATPPAGFRRDGDTFYRGNDRGTPAIGDMRVNFTAVTAQTMSVVAAAAGNSLAPFRSDNGYTIKLAVPGVASAIQMLKEQEQSERTLTWIIRAVGFVAMAIGFMLILGPLSTLASVLPFLGGMIEAGAFVIGFGLAIPITLVVIALAWVANRPLLGIGLLVLAAVVFGGLVYRHRHGRAQSAPVKS
jgi:hypothetical protein